MKLNFLKPLAFTAVLALAMAGCVNDDDYGIPSSVANCEATGLTANKTVQEIASMASGTMHQYLGDDVIEGYVTSSDERGNFFKSVSVQTMPTDGSAPVGFSIAIDDNTLFGYGLYPGNKVYVKLDSLYYAKVDGSLKIGADYNGTVGRISQADYKSSIIPACNESVDEDQLVRPLTISEALHDANLNTLIDLQNVQFVDTNVGGTYYDPSNDIGGATNLYLMDAAGNQVIFRTSSFANFSGDIVPGESGTVRGVLTKYGSDYQFMARSSEDIMLTETRMDAAPPVVGNAITYGLYNENFESYAANNSIFPNAVNDPAVGSRLWQVKSFSGNKYIQMTSFGGTPEANRTLFIVPVDMTAASTFSFQTLAGYDNGAVLKVYYSTDYTPGGDINDATLTDITSQFTIPAGPSNGYASSFTNSGVYNIPASITGNGYFIFEYKGNGNSGPTTTMEIDNIVVN